MNAQAPKKDKKDDDEEDKAFKVSDDSFYSRGWG
jgi:hypothetical protein